MALATHRLNGLEPENLLAFMALLGLLRCVGEARPGWHTRVYWTVSDPPLRPAILTPLGTTEGAVVDAVSEGLSVLSACHEFDGRKKLSLTPAEAADSLHATLESTDKQSYRSDLWASLISDAALDPDGKQAVPTPLCLMFGQGHQYFLERLATVPKLTEPPARGKGRNKVSVTEMDCLYETLFLSWKRPDKTESFRWDPNEDVRYALRAHDPTYAKTKETTQHGANRLAAIGLSCFTVCPIVRFAKVRLDMLGSRRESNGSWCFQWPIWKEPISLAGIRALLGHPNLDNPETLVALGVVEVRRAHRISNGKYLSVSNAETLTAK